jgi:hypothetical protein
MTRHAPDNTRRPSRSSELWEAALAYLSRQRPGGARLAALAMCGFLASAAVAASSAVEVARPVPDRFDGLKVVGHLRVTLVQAPVASITVVGPKSRIDEVLTEVVAGTLQVTHPPSRRGSQVQESGPPMQVVLGVPTLKAIALQGSSSVSAKSLAVESLTISQSGSGQVWLEGLELRTLAVAIAGSGRVRLGGAAHTQAHQVRGSGRIHAEQLAGQNVSISMQGSGVARLGSAEQLNVSIQGSGEVHHRGAPRVTQSIKGTGRVLSNAPSRT